MTNLKQIFADYTRKKREGVSTEAERREIAALSETLNRETQQHLANLFKHADHRLQEMIRSEKEEQLLHLRNVASAMKNAKRKQRSATAGEADDTATANPLRLTSKKARLRALMRNAYGLDSDVAATILRNLRAQENFLEVCEVMLRMTVGTGFSHTSKDESLDAYIKSLRDLYSMNPETFATVDFVKFLAALEHAAPLEWAKRWYEKALLIPLQSTTEYQALRRVQEEEESRARMLIQEHQKQQKDTEETSSQTPGGTESETASIPHDALVAQEIASSAATQEKNVIQLADKMFLRPDDERLASIHEKRLRYLAFLQVESQISRAREHSKRFAGVEHLPEAERCRELYRKIQERKNQVATGSATGDDAVFSDVEVQNWFHEIHDIVKKTIRDLNRKNAADRKAEQIARIINLLKGGSGAPNDPVETPAEAAQRLLNERRTAAMEKILSMVERDVEEDVKWMDALQETERPPLLPIPEPMSYVSASDVAAWQSIREERQRQAGSPFKKQSDAMASHFRPSLLGVEWSLPDKPLLFWGTGVTALQQALKHAADDAAHMRDGQSLPPAYPCAENPWGWRLAKDILDDV